MEMFPAIENAWCYDETRPGKKDFHQDLIPAGADRFVNADGDVYERAVSKGDGVERFICIRKKGKSAAAASAPASGGGAPRTDAQKTPSPKEIRAAPRSHDALIYTYKIIPSMDYRESLRELADEARRLGGRL